MIKGLEKIKVFLGVNCSGYKWRDDEKRNN